MIVLDTHVWLWWASVPSRLSRRVRQAIEDADSLGICTISCWEVAMLVARGRISLDRDVETWVRQALAVEKVEPLTLTADIAVKAGLLDADRFPGDPVDRIVYATASLHAARLATKDRELRSYAPRHTLW